MSSTALTIGPVALSSDHIRKANQQIADSWKGHRLIALVPLAISAIYFVGAAENLILTKALVVIVPQTLLFLGALLLRPYRKIERIECTLTFDEESLSIEVRIDRRRPSQTSIRWRDVVGLEQLDDSIILYLRSGGPIRIPEECLASGGQREQLIACALSGLPG